MPGDDRSDTDSAGVYFMPVEAFEARKPAKPSGRAAAAVEAPDPGAKRGDEPEDEAVETRERRVVPDR